MDPSINLFVSLFQTGPSGSKAPAAPSDAAHDFMEMVKGYSEPFAKNAADSDERNLAVNLDVLRKQLSSLSKQTEKQLSKAIQSEDTPGQVESIIGQSISQFWAILQSFDHQNGTNFVADFVKQIGDAGSEAGHFVTADNISPLGKDKQPPASKAANMQDSGKSIEQAGILFNNTEILDSALPDAVENGLSGQVAIDRIKVSTTAKPVKLADDVVNQAPAITNDQNPVSPEAVNHGTISVGNTEMVVAKGQQNPIAIDVTGTPEAAKAIAPADSLSKQISAGTENVTVQSKGISAIPTQTAEKSDFFQLLFDRLNGTDTRVKISNLPGTAEPVLNGKTSAGSLGANESQTPQASPVIQAIPDGGVLGNIIRGETGGLLNPNGQQTFPSRVEAIIDGKTPDGMLTPKATDIDIITKTAEILFASAKALLTTKDITEPRDPFGSLIAARSEFQTIHTLPKVESQPPPSAPSFSKNIAAQIPAEALKPGQTRIELAPRGLGSLVIDLQSRDSGGIQVMLRAENPSVLHALRTDRDALITVLSTSGVPSDKISLDFGAFGQGGFNHEKPESGLLAQTPPLEDEFEEPVTLINQPVRNGLLDFFT